MIMTPGRAFELRNSKYDWGYKATMIKRDDYERVEKPHTRGKVLGGCSCLNYYTWVRGSHGTYDDWVPFGGKEWGWNGCEEYFDKVAGELSVIPSCGCKKLMKDKPANYHDDGKLFNPALAKIVGRRGPLDVAISDMVPELTTFRDALTKAWVSKGEALTDNIYEGQQRGLVKCMNTIYNGQRSTSVAFLDGKPNITILAETRVTKVLLDGDTAYGVEAVDAKGMHTKITAKREVVLSAGVFHTCKLLMLSGIGPKAHLESFNIPCVLDSSHVGQDLLDHPILPHVFKIKDGVGLDAHLLRAGPMRESAVRAYTDHRKGPLRSGLLELVGFPRIDARLMEDADYVKAKEANGGLDPFGPDGQPHFEIDFVPMFADAFQWHFPTPVSGDHLTVIVDLLRPVSKPGEVRLLSADYNVQPYINLNFCADDLDVMALREGVRFVDDIIMNGEGMKDLAMEDYPWPMPRASDEAMNRLVLERLQTGFHPCGTARLGQDIEQGVVDSRLKVHGIKNLRVVDASIFPVIPDCRIQNVVYMVAEKVRPSRTTDEYVGRRCVLTWLSQGADIIKEDHADLFVR